MKYPNLELIEERFFNTLNATSETNIKRGTYEVYVFPQIWGSTALGFGGVGCSAMTKAYTTVINQENTSIYGVFFGEKLAYIVENPTYDFYQDIKNHNMASLNDYTKYNRE